MNQRNVDVAIIGAGTAGLGARRAGQKAGKSVLMIDPGPFGTTCARVGCMPSKLLIAAAEAAHHAAKAPIFGVHPENIRIDGPAVNSGHERLQLPEAPAQLRRQELMSALHRAIGESLTGNQQEALHAKLSGMPMSEIARRLQTTRGALYKLLHDARQLESKPAEHRLYFFGGRESDLEKHLCLKVLASRPRSRVLFPSTI